MSAAKWDFLCLIRNRDFLSFTNANSSDFDVAYNASQSCISTPKIARIPTVAAFVAYAVMFFFFCFALFTHFSPCPHRSRSGVTGAATNSSGFERKNPEPRGSRAPKSTSVNTVIQSSAEEDHKEVQDLPRRARPRFVVHP